MAVPQGGGRSGAPRRKSGGVAPLQRGSTLFQGSLELRLAGAVAESLVDNLEGDGVLDVDALIASDLTASMFDGAAGGRFRSRQLRENGRLRWKRDGFSHDGGWSDRGLKPQATLPGRTAG